MVDFQGTYEQYLQKHEKDYLGSLKLMKSNSKEGKKNTVSDQKLSYQEKKDLKSAVAKLEKQVKLNELEINDKEKKLLSINEKFASNDFYSTYTQKEVLELNNLKNKLETELEVNVKEWEKANNKLDKARAKVN